MPFTARRIQDRSAMESAPSEAPTQSGPFKCSGRRTAASDGLVSSNVISAFCGTTELALPICSRPSYAMSATCWMTVSVRMRWTAWSGCTASKVP